MLNPPTGLGSMGLPGARAALQPSGAASRHLPAHPLSPRLCRRRLSTV